MPSSSTSAGIAAGLLLVAALAGCAGPATPSPTPLGSSRDGIPPSADPGPAVTFGPDRAALAEFESHLRMTVQREGNLVQELAAASAGSTDALRAALGHARTWVDAERAWLGSHPPAACYTSAGDSLTAAAGAMSDAIDAFAGAAAGPANPSDDVSVPSAQVAAANAIQEVRSELNDASVNAAAARTTCT